MRRIGHGRPALMVSSATAGMMVALRALGVKSGSEVVIPSCDWSSNLEIVRLLGATPVVADYAEADALAHAISAKTAAVVVSHVGRVLDVARIKAAAGSVPIVEDCARAFSARAAARPGETGDYLVFSYGPGTQIDVGEGGMDVSCDAGRHRRLIAMGAHPIRQTVEGVEFSAASLSFRPHPAAAILLALELADFERKQEEGRADNSTCVSPGVVYDISSLASPTCPSRRTRTE